MSPSENKSEKKSKQVKRFLVLHGPNLNLLGERETDVYGTMTLQQLNSKIKKYAEGKNVQLKVFQKNGEGDLIDLLHGHRKMVDAIIFNPGAYTHYSYALRDAVAAIQVPTVEVHLSDILKREEFRQVSVIAPVCVVQISGFGWKSYTYAIDRLLSEEAKESH